MSLTVLERNPYGKRETFSSLLPLLQPHQLTTIPFDVWMTMIGSPFIRTPLMYIPKKLISEVWKQRGKLDIHADDKARFVASIASYLPDELLPELARELDWIRDGGLGPYRSMIELILIQRDMKIDQQTRKEKYLQVLKQHIGRSSGFSELLDMLSDELMIDIWKLVLDAFREMKRGSDGWIGPHPYQLKENLRSIANRLLVIQIEEATAGLLEAFIQRDAQSNSEFLDSREISLHIDQLLSKLSIEQQAVL